MGHAILSEHCYNWTSLTKMSKECFFKGVLKDGGSNKCNLKYRGLQTDSLSKNKLRSKCGANHQSTAALIVLQVNYGFYLHLMPVFGTAPVNYCISFWVKNKLSILGIMFYINTDTISIRAAVKSSSSNILLGRS